MSVTGKLTLIAFAALLIVGLLGGLARDFYSRETGRFEATVVAITAAGNDYKSPTPRLTKLEARTVDGRDIVITSGLLQGIAPGDRIRVATRVTPWGQTWYSLAGSER